jgi:hypothetical protein
MSVYLFAQFYSSEPAKRLSYAPSLNVPNVNVNVNVSVLVCTILLKRAGKAFNLNSSPYTRKDRERCGFTDLGRMKA